MSTKPGPAQATFLVASTAPHAFTSWIPSSASRQWWLASLRFRRAVAGVQSRGFMIEERLIDPWIHSGGYQIDGLLNFSPPLFFLDATMDQAALKT